MSLRERWVATWEALGTAPPAGLFEEVAARYTEPHRHYHTARHLEECFAELEGLRGEAERPGEVELALWLHDAVYDPRRHDNEQRSADWARSIAAKAGLDPSVGERIAALILATRHDAEPIGADACVLVDVDLSILGAEPLRFDEYERDVREEYRWVPEAVFRRERRKILRRLLARPALFNTAQMRESRERRARANLERSLALLRPDFRAVGDAVMASAGIASIVVLPLRFGVSPVWAGASAAAACVLYLALRRRLSPASVSVRRGKAAESAYTVTCDDEGVTVTRGDKPVESVRWNEVTAVLIRIDDGFLSQPWWIVRGANGGCLYPNDARGAQAAIDKLASRLPGFDYAAVVKAMGLASGGVIVWTSTDASRSMGPRR